MRITVEHDRCIGSGACVFTQPAVFTQDEEDGRVVLLQDVPDTHDLASVERAVLLCPVSAIFLERGKRR
ncbi:ferredoxin [Streptomyces sp. V3I8]|uniref:ferredoxin n=1 Tax=Streptomyces sp. V3I8 TaxID=3042279 RepID=UPI002787878A|nr:ferredoxin [Streptomyces sp. V3I8]MDQ1041741.1 ferredoxin [Streptomyces sp. V3I8]